LSQSAFLHCAKIIFFTLSIEMQSTVESFPDIYFWYCCSHVWCIHGMCFKSLTFVLDRDFYKKQFKKLASKIPNTKRPITTELAFFGSPCSHFFALWEWQDDKFCSQLLDTSIWALHNECSNVIVVL